MMSFNRFRIEWECRRGMRELDEMIMPFYKNHFDNLSQEQQNTFVEMLKFTDPELFRWLMNQEQAPQEAMQQMVKLIQSKLDT
ncbi:succinate dehydrogenase assembly factor 2 [Pasteurella atlantica]|uniref:FAD assembly factor SdhE n=3 Tax=Pasteurellaceae TaxID=712 RepID=A0AAQ4M0L0_9PAST|nr:succinate dehydrogenase assembly factor 2 [Pasteurella atlantica]MBR0573324.1 succinate dehydrogenase assembly factor 2 [Pasteurella atlantica]MDP8032794.1 succinate dehydrogenase assembly factor 2 [Pasteurella atlantica]MDP8034700.1 succinate dehydrogenase assembly factor 2 [Pasteurella atlantica]MDP8036650.1 succinate dehydrogenase assembly factor 2 [Pasteurella atlantica]MDP8040124.1 succinate dehydrogenase assembly factor 2 [Pasteurella atlantica]